MKPLLLGTSVVMCILLWALCSCQDYAADPTTGTAEWTVYCNEKYAYEIWYPADLVFDLTGSEGERDGREFRISPGMAYGPGLSCYVYPELAAVDVYRYRWKLTGHMIPGIAKIIQRSGKDSLTWSYEVTKSGVGDKMALMEEARWTPSETFTTRSLFLDGVVFIYSPGGFDPEAEGPMSWPTVLEIVSSFRFLPESEPANQD